MSSFRESSTTVLLEPERWEVLVIDMFGDKNFLRVRHHKSIVFCLILSISPYYIGHHKVLISLVSLKKDRNRPLVTTDGNGDSKSSSLRNSTGT